MAGPANSADPLAQRAPPAVDPVAMKLAGKRDGLRVQLDVALAAFNLRARGPLAFTRGVKGPDVIHHGDQAGVRLLEPKDDRSGRPSA
jgi:hypothetical protein